MKMINERTRRESEIATLVQRFQLNTLCVILQKQEDDVSALESECARQASDLVHLEKKRADLQKKAGIVGLSTQEPDIAEMADRPRPSVRDMEGDRQRATDLSSKFSPPDVGEDWDAYFRNVERYISDHGIEVSRDPIEQLLPPHRAADIIDSFDAEFSSAPWDRWDYGIVALAVLVGSVMDYLFVATPCDTFKGQLQRESQLTSWMKKQSTKLAPISGYEAIERNAFQQWIAELTTKAEEWAKVPYDVVRPKVGLTPNVHRLASLGHDPLFGLIFGIGDIISGNCTFIDKSGTWQVIDNTRNTSSNILEALVKVVVHGFSDVFTPRGLPAPFMAQLQSVDANSGFTLKEGGDSVSVQNVISYMYSNGYDLRHFVTTAISPGIAEIILWVYHRGRSYIDESESQHSRISNRLKREKMLVLTHSLLASANVLKTALYGWNPMAINIAQFVALARRMFSLWKIASERDRLVQKRLDDGWKSLLDDARIHGG